MTHAQLEQRFTHAYDEYADALFRHCYFRIGDRERGREMMQEAFMKSWDYVTKGNEIKDLRAFLYRTANNLIVDQLRRKSRRREESLEDMQEDGFDVVSEEDATREVEQVFAEAQVVAILQRVNEPYRTAVVMRNIDCLSPQQMAEALGESVNAVSVRVNSGMKMLRSLLPANG